MSWVRLDDQFHSHPKVLAALDAHPRAVALHVLALTFSASQLTDGAVPRSFVKRYGGAKVAEVLVAVGLWEPHDDGWMMPTWRDHIKSREKVEQERREWAERQRRARGHADVTP